MRFRYIFVSCSGGQRALRERGIQVGDSGVRQSDGRGVRGRGKTQGSKQRGQRFVRMRHQWDLERWDCDAQTPESQRLPLTWLVLALSWRRVGCVACDPSSPHMKTRTPVALLLLLALPAISFAASEPKIDHYVHLTPENSAIGNFPARKAPILTVKSGAIVKVDTGGGAGWRNAKQDRTRGSRKTVFRPRWRTTSRYAKPTSCSRRRRATRASRTGTCSSARSQSKARCPVIHSKCGFFRWCRAFLMAPQVARRGAACASSRSIARRTR